MKNSLIVSKDHYFCNMLAGGEISNQPSHIPHQSVLALFLTNHLYPF